MQLNKSVRLYFLISVWKNIWLTCSHRVEPCVVCFQISYLDWWIVAMKCIFSPLCVSKCVFRCTVWLNVLSHCTHLWFFSPLWMSRCLFRFTTLLNDLLQSGQRCIFTPLCVSKWVFRCPASLNDLLHSAHLCDFSPLWMSMWVFRFTAWLNDLLHSEHMCNFSPMWVNIWLASWLEYLNDLTHMLQGCEFALSKNWSVLLLLLVDNDWGKFVPTLYMICPSTKKSLPCTIFIMTLLLLDFSSLCGL